MGTKNHTTWVSIKAEKNIYEVKWEYDVLQKKTEDGKILCYVQGFDLYFGAANAEIAEKKSLAVTHLFFDHFFIHNKKHALKYLAKDLKKKGFHIDAYRMGQYMKDKATSGKFESNSVPPMEFIDAEKVNQRSEMSIAY